MAVPGFGVKVRDFTYQVIILSDIFLSDFSICLQTATTIGR